ncbi:hypothetical protein AcW1_001765 [Taiwanofungus camphoratus]|nr:hypothetical protein AcW1_001765 [Antrodia cinnamomea]
MHPISTPEAPVHQFRGIKYATIPARFRQSRLYTSYPPQTDATRFGPICPQPKYKGFDEHLFGISEDAIPQQNLKQSEFECLNLNITCPANVTPESRLPVMLWIHGGGNRGSGSNWIFDGGALVQKSIQDGKPIIFISFNYRLGLLGFAASPALREENQAAGDDGVGNYGLRDQRRALEWVYHFISDFGGNPSNITLFGESSGAADILCHLQSDANEKRPLFQRAIVQSAIMELDVPNVSAAGSQLSRIMCALHTHSVEDLRSVEPEKLVALGQNVRATNDGVFFRKGFTGSLVHEEQSDHHHHHLAEEHLGHIPEYLGRSHRLKSNHHLRASSRSRSRTRHTPRHASSSNSQPIMIGDCSEESLLWSFSASLWTAGNVERRIRAICQSLSKATALLRAYDINRNTPADELPSRILELINDARFAWPTECIATSAKLERGGRGVWRYVFDQEGPARGVPHNSVDLIYLFDNVPLPSQAYGTSQSASVDMMPESFGDLDDDENDSDLSTDSGFVDDWGVAVVDEWTYTRVRNAVQERWIAFAHGEVPWQEDKVYVFGPEGEIGERSWTIFNSRRRTRAWREALEPLGMRLVQKLGSELSNGPPLPSRAASL